MIVKIDKLKTRPKTEILLQKNLDDKKLKDKNRELTYIQCRKCNMIFYRDIKINFGLKKKDIKIESIKNILNSKCSAGRNDVEFTCRKCGKLVGRLNKVTDSIQVCQQSVKFHYIYLQQKQKPQHTQTFNPSSSFEYSGMFQGIKSTYLLHYLFKSLFNKCQRYKLMFEINDQIMQRNNCILYRRALFVLEDYFAKNKQGGKAEMSSVHLNEASCMKDMHSTKAQTSEFNTKIFRSIRNNTNFGTSQKNHQSKSKILDENDNQLPLP